MTGKTFSNFQLNFAQLNFTSPTSLHQLHFTNFALAFIPAQINQKPSNRTSSLSQPGNLQYRKIPSQNWTKFPYCISRLYFPKILSD